MTRQHQDLMHAGCQTYKKKPISKASLGRHTKAKHSDRYCCDTCGEVLRSQQALDQHTETKHPRRYCCDTCSIVLPSQQALAQHHTDKHLFFECLYCKCKFTTRQSLDQHEEYQHSHRYCCDMCGKVLRSQQALDQHTETKHPRRYCCDTCSIILPSKQALAQHHTDKHLFFECLYCECKFTTSQSLDQHEEYQHSPCYCDTCGTALHSQEALDQHHIDNHPLFEEQYDESQHWYCQTCEKEFVSKATFDQHMRANHPPCYYCDTCGTALHSQEALDQHHIDNHPLFEGQYDESQHWYCQTCEKEFVSKATFDQHTRANHPPCYYCDTCGTALHSQEALDQHHTDRHTPLEWMLRARVPSLAPDTREAQHPPRFECQYCDLKFSTDDARRNHEDDEHHRAFEWQHGDLMFASDDARLQHENAKHNFTCRYCNQAFILPESRHYHEQMNHILAFQCSCCCLDFHTMHERDAHEKFHHSYYGTVVSSLSAAQPQPVPSCSSALSFSPRSIRSKPSHISDTKRSQLASSATSQCSHAEADESLHDPAQSQTSDEAQTSDEETSSLDEQDISHPSDDSPSITRPQDLICCSAIYEQPCTYSICQRPPASPCSSSTCDDDKPDDGQDDARSIASGGSDSQDGPAEDFQAVCLCVSCSQVFDTDKDLRGHGCASRGTIFQLAPQCSFCYIQFGDESSLLKHLNEDRMSFRCHLCQTLCCSNDMLQAHLLDHPTCRRCGEVFIDDLTLCNHVGSEHPVAVCWDCDGAVVEQDSLELHYAVSSKHPSCRLCGVGKRDTDDMEEHIKNRHITELYDFTPSEIEMSQSNEQVAIEGSPTTTSDEESVLVEKQPATENGGDLGQEVLGEPEPEPSSTTLVDETSSLVHEELHEPPTSPLQTDIPLSINPPSTLPSSHREADHLVVTTAASGVASAQLSAQYIRNHRATELHNPTPDDIEVPQSNEQVAIDGSSNTTGDGEPVQIEKQPATDNGDGFERGALGEPEPPSPTSVKETSSPMREELHDPRTGPLQIKLSLSLSTASWLRFAVLLLINIYLYRRK
ncbi:hypothetical protein PAXINDRAFT_100062 [Paxillus involutus ATCC 200175]|uniref:C2H2-type domain-containing protein n=1 Tax=Paxillus involutus ATCC 200175 TaxID=664439 RepID=A0A0C9U606_PAXIN|nr:hypothetical protein PAXINDRAFT_100062 [Paxillus involutus ATCC 200175]